MVFESVVTDVLNKVLCDYIENLDRKQLKIGIWGGDVVLQNLKIGEKALDDLDLPVQLIYGSLGKLVLKIPWKNLYSQPVVAQIEDLYILVAPKLASKYDAEKEANRVHQDKLAKLNGMEDEYLKEQQKDKPKPDATLTEKLTVQIINNIEIKISNVHLRYEDKTTIPGKPFSFGVTLHDLDVFTTDLNWRKSYMTEQAGGVFKIANLSCLAVYMNNSARLFSNEPDNVMAELFKENIAQKDYMPPRYKYVLGPLSCYTKLKLNINPEFDDPPFQKPKVDLCLEMEALNIGLTNVQFKSILYLGDAMNRAQLGTPYRKFRPFNIPYKGHYKEWWKFAIQSVQEGVKQQNIVWTWAHMKKHRELCNAYYEKYKERKISKKPSANLCAAVNLIEQELNLFNLILIRQRVLLDISKMEAQKEEESTGWFGGWFSKGRKSTDSNDSNIADKFAAAMTKEEKDKLYRAIGYEENATPINVPETFEAIQMQFKLHALKIGLYNDSVEQPDDYRATQIDRDMKEIWILNFYRAEIAVALRPAANALCVTARMKEMRSTGFQVGDVAPVLIESKITDEHNLLDIFYETNPLDGNCDQRIKIRARPLQITYDGDTILRLIDLFSPVKSVNLSELEGAATARMATFKERSATGMQYIIDTHPKLDIDILFLPNILIIPHTGFYDKSKSLVVISLGQLHITSMPHKNMDADVNSLFEMGNTQSEILRTVMDKAYDNYQVHLGQMQVLVVKQHEEWEQLLMDQESTSELYMLQPTTILVNASVCVVDDDPRLPKTKINIDLPAIEINVTEERVIEALRILTSIPLPKNEEPPPNLLKSLQCSTPSVRSSISNFLTRDSIKPKVKRPKSKTDLVAEIVQYTNLEVNFTLNKISVVLYKTCRLDQTCKPDEVQSDESPTTTTYGTPVDDVISTIPDAPDNEPQAIQSHQQLLALEILFLEAHFADRTYEMEAEAKLGAINLKQYDRFDNTDLELDIINTPNFSKDKEYLLNISYRFANKISPEFATKYNSIEQFITIKFSTLSIVLHQECLLHLLELAHRVQKDIDDILATLEPRDHMTTADTGEFIAKQLTVIFEDAEEDEEAHPVVADVRKKPVGRVVDSIKLRLVANLNEVNLVLTSRHRPLAKLEVQHFDAGVLVKCSYTEMNFNLKNIIVTDLNPETIHTYILSICGHDVLNCQVILYNLDETSNYNSDDMKVTVDIGCMKIVFLNWFVTGVMDFANKFQVAQQAIAIAGAAAADAAKKNALDAYEKATRIKLFIKIKAPIIIVPIDSQSYEALALDLGFLQLSNTITELDVPNSEHQPVIDELKLDMKDMKLSKVDIIDPRNTTREEAKDTVDKTYGIKSHMNIMNPISFALCVKRNLSSNWYKELPELDISGRLKSIELNLCMHEYALIMSILERNLAEGQHEFPPTIQPTTNVTNFTTPATPATPLNNPNKASWVQMPKSLPKKKVYEQMKFNFQFDGVIVNIMESENLDLARFGLYFLSVKGNKLIDGTLSTSIVLCNIQIDDMRKDTNSKITQYLTRKDWAKNSIKYVNTNDVLQACERERNFMVDVTAIIKENDTFAEVRVSGFDLILCIDFLLKLATFFSLPEKDPHDIKQGSASSASGVQVVRTSPTTVAAPPSPTPAPVMQKKMNLILHIDEPDIILIESLDDFNTNAIVFNAQARLNYRSIDDHQLIVGEINALKMYMCSFMPERREATKHYILHPCVISLQGSTPEQQGLHMSLKLSEIIINISPATIELFNKALVTISSGSAQKALAEKQEKNYEKIWQPSSFQDRDLWFVRPDQSFDVLETLDNNQLSPANIKTEKCVFEVPSITIVFESGVGYYTTPLVAIDTRINAVIGDWSNNLSINGSLTLSMNYYNQSLAEWEPIIELNERVKLNGESEYLPWELNFNLSREKVPSEFDDNVEDMTTAIKIHSEKNLELTLSKTCFDLVSELSEAFSQAIDSKGLMKPEVIAPFVVENDTGFDISINFVRGIFTLHECHMPTANTSHQLNSSLIFHATDTVADIKPDEVKTCTISSGGRAYMQTKDASTMNTDVDEEYNIFIKIGDIRKEIVLPVSKADKRFFMLSRDVNQDQWGIISEVTNEYGTTRINVHGVVNILNHFTNTIEIYRERSSRKEKTLVGKVKPGEVFHVPLHAVYAENKELYFSLPGYKVSVQGVSWNDSPTDMSYSRQLQCDPINTFEPLYIKAVRQKTEVFHEHSNKFKVLSASYTIHLRPPLYLRNALPIDIKVSVAGCSVQESTENTPTDTNMLLGHRQTYVKEEFLDYGEKEVNPGDVLQLPTVKLMGKRKFSKSFLVIRLMQYLEKDWSCTTEIDEQYDHVATWLFSSYDSASKMDMDLFVRFDDRHGSLMITLYSPYWLINKTDLMLSYKTDIETIEVLYHPPEYSGPILFSFRDKVFFMDKKRASIRVDNGDWSDKIPLDIAGALGSVTCKSDHSTYQIGVHNHITHNSLTKQITFIPFYIASNKCNFTIELQEQSRPADPWLKIDPNECVPFWPQNSSDCLVVARVQNQRTTAFDYTEMISTLLQLEANKYGGINVDVQATEGGVYITFTPYQAGDAPGLLINHTTEPVTYYEKSIKKERVLQKQHKVLFTWGNPTGEKLIVFGNNKIETDLRRDDIGELALPGGKKAFWVSFLDGLQRVLLFTELESIAEKTESSAALQRITQSFELRIHGIALSVINNVTGIDIMYLGITNSGIIWESRKPNKKRFKQMNIHDTAILESHYQHYQIDKSVNQVQDYLLDNKYPIDFNEMTLRKNNVARTIQRNFYPGVWISMKSSPFQTQLHLKIHKIQLDNQLSDPIFPVVLAPIAPPKSVATTTTQKPFIECSVVQRIIPHSAVRQYKYASMLIQEFHFKVDLLFLTAIAEMFTSNLTDEQAAKLFADNVDTIEKPLSEFFETHSQQEQKNYYDHLHLGPLKIHVSFSMAGSDTTALPGILGTLVQGVGVTLTDVNDVVFRLAFFDREYQFFTQRQLINEITSHYTGQAIKQLYVLVLGLDVLGNPYGLVIGFKKGVEDLFYEPFQGAIQGPGEFAEGLVLGVKSLFGHTVGGAAGAMSKITGAVGKGLAALTFDEDYQRKRRKVINNKPKNFHEGMARSSKGLVMGFVDGVTGVVTKPVAGAREEGVEGFLKGLGKGAIGLVARPTAGVVDFASGTFESVKRATETGEEVHRLRPARFQHDDNVLRPYCLSEAKGNKLLKEIEKGKYASTDSFIHCEEIVVKTEYVIVSNYRVIYVKRNETFGNWMVQWTYLWSDVSSVSATNRGVEIKVKKESTKKIMGFISPRDAPHKVVFIAQKEKRDKLAALMESQRIQT